MIAPRHAKIPHNPNPNAFSEPWIIHICGIVSAQSGTTCRRPNPIAESSETPEITKAARTNPRLFSNPR
jgi:hypothetical protein